MKVVVFGGSGFIGGHVADVLTESGHKVRVFDINPSPYLKSDQEMVIGDILDEKGVNKAVEGCDYIYHFAGIADLDDATTKSIETVIKNIKGTAILLEAARKTKAKRRDTGGRQRRRKTPSKRKCRSDRHRGVTGSIVGSS